MLGWLRSVWLTAALMMAAPAIASDASTPSAESASSAIPLSCGATPSTATSRLGAIRFVIPPGQVPRLGPAEVADVLHDRGFVARRAGGSVREIVCMEFHPGPATGDGGWSIHARGAFWFQAPAGGSSCRSEEAVLQTSEDGWGSGISILESSCVDAGERLIKGR